jgi:hypothetical protein
MLIDEFFRKIILEMNFYCKYHVRIGLGDVIIKI